MNTAKSLATITLTSRPLLFPQTPAAPSTTPEAPAIEVMTDFMRIAPVIAEPDETVIQAEQRMIQRGVRSVLVVERNQLLGLLTAADILGEKLVQTAHRLGLSPKELKVAQLMTPAEQLDALSFDHVARATVAEVIATLQRLGRQHLLVIDTASDPAVVRGIFSATQIARQLGSEVPVVITARTFAEIEAELR